MFTFRMNLLATLFRFLGHTFPVFESHFSGFWVTLFRILGHTFRFLGHTFPVFESYFSGFWVTLFRFLGHTFPVFGSSIVPAYRPGSHFSGMPAIYGIRISEEVKNYLYKIYSLRNIHQKCLIYGLEMETSNM